MVPGAGLEPARPCGQRILLTLYSFHCHAALPRRFGVWTISLPYTSPWGAYLGRGRLVSTLSRRVSKPCAGLSSGLPSARPVKGSPNLTPAHHGFPRGGPVPSPLRLPIPPPGQTAAKLKDFGGYLQKRENQGNGGWARNRTEVRGFAVRCITTLPPSLGSIAPISPARRASGRETEGASYKMRVDAAMADRPATTTARERKMERETRFELATFALARRRSTS